MRDPKHILITGASSGIGAALAALYAVPGVRLSLHGRDRDRLVEVALMAAQRGAAAATHSGDVTDKDGMAEWVAACEKEQPLDLVIANAGISEGTGRRSENTEQARAIFATNVLGVLNTVHPALAPMRVRGKGQIAIMSSLAGFRGFAGASAYCASKAAVRIYGESLRAEHATHGVEVNVICPGFIKTPMTDANPFPMPLIMSAERAAALIKHGLAHNRARIAFPFPIYALARLVAGLPQGLLDHIGGILPRKR